MIIKKFQGKTEMEAAEAAKKELGQNVVIMNVRNVKKKGLFRIFSPELVEVTVALEEESERYSSVKGKRQEASQERAVAAEAAAGGQADAAQGASHAPPASGRNAWSQPVSEVKKDRNMIEEKLDNLHSLLEQQLQKPEPELPAAGEDDTEEAKEERNELEKFMRLLYNTMLDNEVDEKYANQIIDEIERNARPNMPFDYALANVYQKMVLKFGKTSPLSEASHGVRIVFFIGPTGVGKTTTIAKLASKYIVEEKKKVALLTADTFRIAAAEQLRTYAGILEAPFRVIYTPDEIGQALVDFKQYDFIFVDTSGHSYRNEEQKANMNAIIHSADTLAEKEICLVLSATTKYRDLLRTVDTYSAMTDYKILFTKLDETDGMGNLLNIRLYTGQPLSYVTYGQNVPDDIEEFNPQKTVKQLLGGKK